MHNKRLILPRIKKEKGERGKKVPNPTLHIPEMPSELSALEGFLIREDYETPFCPPAFVMYIYNSFLFVQIRHALSP